MTLVAKEEPGVDKVVFRKPTASAKPTQVKLSVDKAPPLTTETDDDSSTDSHIKRKRRRQEHTNQRSNVSRKREKWK